MKTIMKTCSFFTLVLMLFLLAMNGVRRQDEALAAQIAPEVLRFHVLANSNSAADQALKLAVKDYLLEELRPHVASKKEAQNYIMRNQKQLEEKADAFIREMGFSYCSEIRLETCEFPRKTYGDVLFPAGAYDAVRILIGDGAGENFWCVLYPSLCYLDSAYAVMPDDSKAILRTIVPEDDLWSVLYSCRARSESPGHTKTEQENFLPRVSFRFKLIECLSSY